jgi:hypothetical protein
MSINYIQALPGTPVYEYARYKGLIGASLREEEEYLLSISDIDAADDTKMPNYTEYDGLTVRSWRRRVVMEVMKSYHDHNKTPRPSFPVFVWRLLTKGIKKTGDHYATEQERRRSIVEEYSKGGYFNLQRDLSYDVIVAYFYPVRNVILSAWLIQEEIRRLPLREVARHVVAWIRCHFFESNVDKLEAESLRQIMSRLAPAPIGASERAMQPLREGR